LDQQYSIRDRSITGAAARQDKCDRREWNVVVYDAANSRVENG